MNTHVQGRRPWRRALVASLAATTLLFTTFTSAGSASDGTPEEPLAGDLEVIPASEVIGMSDDPGASVRRKKDSSLVRAAEAVRETAVQAARQTNWTAVWLAVLGLLSLAMLLRYRRRASFAAPPTHNHATLSTET